MIERNPTRSITPRQSKVSKKSIDIAPTTREPRCGLRPQGRCSDIGGELVPRRRVSGPNGQIKSRLRVNSPDFGPAMNNALHRNRRWEFRMFYTIANAKRIAASLKKAQKSRGIDARLAKCHLAVAIAAGFDEWHAFDRTRLKSLFGYAAQSVSRLRFREKQVR